MDLKKFKLNLESTLGKRLEKLNKDLLICKVGLEKVKKSLKQINNYVERKNYHPAKRHSLIPKTLSQPILPTIKDFKKQTPKKSLEENKQAPYIKRHGSLVITDLPFIDTIPQKTENLFLKSIKKSIRPCENTPQNPIINTPQNHFDKAFNTDLDLKTHTKSSLQDDLDIINTQIKDIEIHQSYETLHSIGPFSISLGAKSAFDIIKGMSRDCFTISENPDKRIIWCLGIIFILLGEDFNPESSESISRIEYFLSSCADSYNISDFLIEITRSFDFSEQNIDVVEEYISGKEDLLAPQIYTRISQLCGLIMVFLREAVVYAGLIKGRSPVWRIYSRLQHKKKQIEGQL
ncbi:hypothetical protein SteCoe_22965 [Stentor coeruleus]|uniref:Uncharacterized protein n=1 Tax=Stentor coeruleus TaxID=5963 RepID=A0A1R2BL31_9CILI|nr:hypothetical protein SteCoe_22965 [Stentor coeruleus]